MHDVLAHRLSLLSVHAGALEYHPGAPAEEIGRAAGVIRASAHQALQDLREVIGVLRAPEGDPRPQPTLSELPLLVEESRQAGMHIDYWPGTLPSPPAALGRTVYRVVQEGLTSARKHAPEQAVRVAVTGRPGGGLSVEVRNAVPGGRTADAIPGAGQGLIGLAELAGGRLEHGRVGTEFRLAAWLPGRRTMNNPLPDREAALDPARPDPCAPGR